MLCTREISRLILPLRDTLLQNKHAYNVTARAGLFHKHHLSQEPFLLE